MTDVTLLDPRRRRILYRARHRGTYENDLMIGGFVATNFEIMSEAELDALEAVMELPDVDLADWLIGRRPIPPDMDNNLMLERMRRAISMRQVGN
jgi:antitoxin CptB